MKNLKKITEPGESWLPIYFAQDRYLVSTHGRVYSLGRDQLVKLKYAARAYVSLSRRLPKFNPTRRRTVVGMVAREYDTGYIVARSFLADTFADHSYIKHKDGNPYNNYTSNLEWSIEREYVQRSKPKPNHETAN